jgi:hypothetical protein
VRSALPLATEGTQEIRGRYSYMLPIEFSKYIWLIKSKMTHKINLPLFESSKTRDSPRNPCHG